MNRHFFSLLLLLTVAFSSFAQPTHVFTDAEKKYKEAKDFFVQEQYAHAYPISVSYTHLDVYKRQTQKNSHCI